MGLKKATRNQPKVVQVAGLKRRNKIREHTDPSTPPPARAKERSELAFAVCSCGRNLLRLGLQTTILKENQEDADRLKLAPLTRHQGKRATEKKKRDEVKDDTCSKVAAIAWSAQTSASPAHSVTRCVEQSSKRTVTFAPSCNPTIVPMYQSVSSYKTRTRSPSFACSLPAVAPERPVFSVPMLVGCVEDVTAEAGGSSASSSEEQQEGGIKPVLGFGWW